MSAPIDAAIREQALDPLTSFIVQAPAGSGKTELLTRRIMTLLATVEEPEDILAITFTRKAASEMRQRVVDTLERASRGEQGSNDYEEEGLALARQVLQHDAKRDWQLIRNPQRLNLRTIDSLAAQLAHRLPVTSALGAPTGLVDDASVIYREVASRFIESNIQSLDLILLQVGNRLEQARSLLANLLASRDQWKRHVYGAGSDHDALRELLEGMLGELLESRLQHLCACLPPGLDERVLPRLRLASHFLLEDVQGDLNEIKPEMQAWIELDAFPGADVEDRHVWKGIAAALLTDTSTLRKRLTKREGYPAKTDAKSRGLEPSVLVAHKQDMLDAIASLAEHPDFVDALAEVRQLPDPIYAEEHWQLLSQLLSVLPDLLVELQWVFAERGVVDFAELAERAQRALGTEDEPTDLALAMDLSLRHILVDEFQDTSQTQFRLFQQLVSVWEPDDGRTFFAVGDPMQSIYRFRDGDVALFGQACEEGIGPVTLTPLTLLVNFRAAPAVTDWVNQTFSAIFPQRADANVGAIPYSPSVAHVQQEGSVELHGYVDRDRSHEAVNVALLAEQALAKGPDHTVAILVRTRSQAGPIFDALRARSLAYESIDMDQVGERAVVRDLLSLCLALRYPHDRLHWLSVLRAPFVGLTLSDLYTLTGDSGSQAAVIERLRDSACIDRLSADGQARVARLMPILEPALKRSARSRLLPWVESVWLQLGGPVVCRDAVDRDAAEQALSRLATLEADGRLWEKSELSEAMRSLYANSKEASECRIQVMTLHKSKGLEFDTVILPALDRQPRGDVSQLLNWFESTLDGHPQLLLAPLQQPGLPANRQDRINRLVKAARQRCDEQEKLRLLYVACTRTKRHLHLLARVGLDVNGEPKAPIQSSLLKPLWSLYESSFVEIPTQAEPVATDALAAASEAAPRLERLPLSAAMPQFSVFKASENVKNDEIQSDAVKFSWAGRYARDVGTVVHEQLQQIATAAREPDHIDLDAQVDIAERQLRHLGVRPDRLDEAIDTVRLALRNTLDDERGRWTLFGHREARSEWALSVVEEPAESGAAGATSGSRVVHQVVIDRTFVDSEGVRWIVDFKTGDHRGGQVEMFLDSEQSRYASQLNRYADIISRVDSRPIKVGLYFPLLKGWREWQPGKEVS